MRICYPAIAAVLLSLIHPLEAKTILFPENDPAFTIKIPDGWKMEVDKDGDVSCDTGEHIGVQFRLNQLNQRFAQAKESLPGLGKVFAKSAKLTEIETKEMGDSTNKNGVKGTIYVVKGKSSGRLLTAELLVIEPKAGKSAYFILFSGLAEALQSHKDDIGAIIDSIKPVD
jgi:hypothetical protein